VNERKKRLIQYAKLSGFLYDIETPGPFKESGCLLNGGLVILSRFPIKAAEFLSFPRGYHIDKYVNKGVLYAKILIKDQPLHIFHSHCFADYTDLEKSMAARINGFHAWRKFLTTTLTKY